MEQRKCSQVKFDQSVRDITLKSPLNFLMSLLLCTDPFYEARWQMLLSNSIREQRKTSKSYWPRKVFCLQGLKLCPSEFSHCMVLTMVRKGSGEFLCLCVGRLAMVKNPAARLHVDKDNMHVSGSYLNFLIGLPKVKTKTRCDYEKRPAICFLFLKKQHFYRQVFISTCLSICVYVAFFCPLSNGLLSSEYQKMR